MDLLKLVLFGRAKLLAVKDILGISQVPRLLIRCFISHIAWGLHITQRQLRPTACVVLRSLWVTHCDMLEIVGVHSIGIQLHFLLVLIDLLERAGYDLSLNCLLLCLDFFVENFVVDNQLARNVMPVDCSFIVGLGHVLGRLAVSHAVEMGAVLALMMGVQQGLILVWIEADKLNLRRVLVGGVLVLLNRGGIEIFQEWPVGLWVAWRSHRDVSFHSDFLLDWLLSILWRHDKGAPVERVLLGRCSLRHQGRRSQALRITWLARTSSASVPLLKEDLLLVWLILLKLNLCCRNVLRLGATCYHLVLAASIGNRRRLRSLVLPSHLLLWHHRVLLGLLGRLGLVLRYHWHRRLGPLLLDHRFLFRECCIRRHICFHHWLILLVIISLWFTPSIHLHDVLDQFWIVGHLQIIFLMSIHHLHLLIFQNILLNFFLGHILSLPVCLRMPRLSITIVSCWILVCVAAWVYLRLYLSSRPYYIGITSWKRRFF